MWQKNKNPISIKGIRLASIAAGIRYPDRLDMCLLEIAPGSQTAGVFTQNLFCAAPVSVAKANLQQGPARYFLINTGSANAGTGKAGIEASKSLCHVVAATAGVDASTVLPYSTGVIGEALPVDKMQAVIPRLFERLHQDAWLQGAQAIMTTDTRPKCCSYQGEISGGSVTITGMAKGSGMIKPNMATMLAFIATDCEVTQDTLQSMLNKAMESSFNAISVDGDTSTNDACMLVSTAQSGVKISTDKEQQVFQQMLDNLCQDLAKDLISDAEGATKFVTISVSSGRNQQECRQVAFTIAESPLVKTALFASDANWGRILAAIGRCGVDLDINAVRISLGDVVIVEAGERAQSYTDEAGQAEMAQNDILLNIDLGLGDAQATVWTSDLSHGYIKINAEYRS